MATDKQLEALKKAMRHKLQGDSNEVSVAAADLRTMLDEIGRLHQSNERLRRQNRRVRLKLQRAGLDADEGAVDGGGSDDDGGADSGGGDQAP